jgi:hypothetical protein
VTFPPETREASAAVLTPGDEESLAQTLRMAGRQVIDHRGHHWIEAPRGFYQPIHWMARLHADEVTRPRQLAWGYRGTLCDEDSAAHANAALPVHILTDVAGYTMEALGRRDRRAVRQCARRATIVELTGPRLLREQGFDVKRSAVQRTAYGSADSREAYLAGIEQYFGQTSRVVLGGIVDRRLGGYLTGTLVGGTAYIGNLFIATEALRTAIGTGLVFQFVQACRRAGDVHEVVYGLHSIEDKPLLEYKERLGFPARRVPAKASVNRFIAVALRRRLPYTYYRLTGVAPPNAV